MKVEHRQIVENLWADLDAVFVVMDASKPASSEEATAVPKMVKRLCDSVRKIPVIVIANKVDEPEAIEDQNKVKEIRRCIAEIFGGVSDYTDSSDFQLPMLIPISAQYALLFRNRQMSKNFEEFRELSKSFNENSSVFDNFGLQELGKTKWKQLKQMDEKLRHIYDALGDDCLFQARMNETNFGCVTKFYREYLGSKTAQGNLLANQLDFKTCETGVEEFIKNLEVYDAMYTELDKPKNLGSCFWKKYDDFENAVFTKVNGKDDVAELQRAMAALETFYVYVWASSWPEKRARLAEVSCAMGKLVKRQIKMAMDMENLHRKDTVETPGTGWSALKDTDWMDIFLSILLCEGSKQFVENFGQYKVALHKLVCLIERSLDCGTSKAAVEHTFRSIPESLGDPNHWGYMAWKFCSFKESYEGS